MLDSVFFAKRKNEKEIVMVFSYYGVGGAQRRAINLANSFVEKGCLVSVVSLYGEDGTLQDDNFFNLDKRVEVVLLPEFYSNLRGSFQNCVLQCKSKWNIRILKLIQRLFKGSKCIQRAANWRIRNIRNCELMSAYLQKHRNAVVVCFGFNIFDRVYLAAKRTRCKIIYAETNAANKYIQENFFEERYGQIKKADGWVFQTHEQLDFFNIKGDNKRVIHNPISSELPMPYEGTRRKAIVNFCRIAPPKNLMLLIKAFEIVNQRFPQYKLYIYGDAYGADGQKYKASLEKYIREKDLDKCVFILPSTAKIHEEILDASMFVSSSDYEGISNSMIEAMAIGLPCVCTDCAGGGAREIIQDGVNGIIVPPNNVDLLAEAMCDFINGEELGEKCSNNALQIRHKLKIETISGEWLSVIKNANKSIR